MTVSTQIDDLIIMDKGIRFYWINQNEINWRQSKLQYKQQCLASYEVYLINWNKEFFS